MPAALACRTSAATADRPEQNRISTCLRKDICGRFAALAAAIAGPSCTDAPASAARCSKRTRRRPVPAAAGSRWKPASRTTARLQPAFPGQTRAPGVRSDVAIDIQVVASGLRNPWAFELMPDGRFLVTEQSGPAAHHRPGRQAVRAAKRLAPSVDGARAGCWTSRSIPASPPTGRSTGATPSRGGAATAPHSQRPCWWKATGRASMSQCRCCSARCRPSIELHFGSRIAFARWQTVPALGERAMPARRVQSQDLGSHFGKVVRLNRWLRAQDNPFVGRSGAKPEIWSYGHRNVQAATSTRHRQALDHRTWSEGRRRTEPAATGQELWLARRSPTASTTRPRSRRRASQRGGHGAAGVLLGSGHRARRA